MRITNKTAWDTRQLHKVFSACLAEVQRHENSPYLRAKNFRVTVETHKSKNTWVGGHAVYYGSYCTIKIPVPTRYSEESNPAKQVADTFIHELGHCIGIKHQSHTINDKVSWYDTIEHLYQEWMDKTITREAFPLGPAKEKPKPVVDVQAKRYEAALANLARAKTRAKRANTIMKKWMVKVRYYERAIAAKKPGPAA